MTNSHFLLIHDLRDALASAIAERDEARQERERIGNLWRLAVDELDSLRAALAASEKEAGAMRALEEWLADDDNVAEINHDDGGFLVWLHGERDSGEGITLSAAILAALSRARGDAT